jgi:hypothetical protein
MSKKGKSNNLTYQPTLTPKLGLVKSSRGIKKTTSPQCDACGIRGHLEARTCYGDAVVTVDGRHPIRKHTGALHEVNHGIQVLTPFSARRLIDYAVGVSSTLTSSLLKLEHEQQPFGQHGSAAQDLAISRDCSRLLTEFTDALDSAITELSAVEYIALEQDDKLQIGIAKATSAHKFKKTRSRRARQ